MHLLRALLLLVVLGLLVRALVAPGRLVVLLLLLLRHCMYSRARHNSVVGMYSHLAVLVVAVVAGLLWTRDQDLETAS